MPLPKPYKFPKTLTGCLARLAKLKEINERLDAERQPSTAEESALRDHLLETFKKDELDGASGHGLSIALTRTTVPTVVDWDAFVKFAKLKGNDDLLARSVNSAAWRERLDAGKQVPGIDAFGKVGLRVSKKS